MEAARNDSARATAESLLVRRGTSLGSIDMAAKNSASTWSTPASTHHRHESLLSRPRHAPCRSQQPRPWSSAPVPAVRDQSDAAWVEADRCESLAGSPPLRRPSEAPPVAVCAATSSEPIITRSHRAVARRRATGHQYHQRLPAEAFSLDAIDMVAQMIRRTFVDSDSILAPRENVTATTSCTTSRGVESGVWLQTGPR